MECRPKPPPPIDCIGLDTAVQAGMWSIRDTIVQSHTEVSAGGPNLIVVRRPVRACLLRGGLRDHSTIRLTSVLIVPTPKHFTTTTERRLQLGQRR